MPRIQWRIYMISMHLHHLQFHLIPNRVIETIVRLPAGMRRSLGIAAVCSRFVCNYKGSSTFWCRQIRGAS